MNKKQTAATSSIKKYNLTYSNKLGRYLVAAKDLSAGEVIFREDALAVGPAIFEKSIFCFSCVRVLPTCNFKYVDYVCSKCKVAIMCNAACENANGFHSVRECNIFKEKKNLYLLYIDELLRNLIYFRLWLVKDDNPEAWDKICSMESHMDKRKNTSIWKECEKNVVEVFRKLQLLDFDNDGESIQQLCGVVDVNTFELRSPGVSDTTDPNTHLLRGLFLEASLMGHECRGTAHVSVDENFRMSVYAAVPIKAGEPISFNYTSCFLGTIDRQQHLQEGKYFRCDCNVCKDPFECGSNLSCILCPRCKKDYVAIQISNEVEPYGNKTKWECRTCKSILFGCLIKRTIEISKDLISQLNRSNYMEMEALLEKLSRTFHKNHFLLLSLKQDLLAVYRIELNKMNPPKKILEKMLKLYQEVLDVLEIVEPGISRLKGIVLYEMHLPVAILANRAYSSREISADKLLSRLEVAQGCLKRSLSMLLLEPANTPEGLLAKRALFEMKLLRQNVEDAKNVLLTQENSKDQEENSRRQINRNKIE